MSKKKRENNSIAYLQKRFSLLRKTLSGIYRFLQGHLQIQRYCLEAGENGIELLCAAWDNVPMLQISSGRSACQFVPLEWEP